MSKGFDRGRFGLLLGYRYEKFKHDIIGVTDLFTGETSYSGVRVLDYEVKYHIPYFGLNFQYFKDMVNRELDNWGVNIQACVSPYVTAKDLDYHLLRNKLSRGDTSGYALMLGLSSFLKSKSNLLWQFGIGYTGIRTKGKQNQYWYGDDPSTPGDDTGTSIDGIGLKIKSAQYLFWGKLQYNF
ncbi:MAG: omptin family outer membrane protease [Candidatus Omnitrophica bacterium]|nr:omptin family outer membrane protease [Candidatus Omnitrophota bacterium]